MRAPDQVWFNGRIVPIDSAAPSVASNTLHLGTAVFDGMMAYWNEDRWNLHLLDGHVARFTRGSANMDLARGYDADAITTAIRELVVTLPPKTHYIRPLAYRTGPEVFFTVEHDTSSVCIFATPVERGIDTPYRCQLSPVVRVAGRAIPVEWKVSGAHANSYRCKQEARRDGFDTGVMLDVDGNVCEASSSNLFFSRDTTLVTPAARVTSSQGSLAGSSSTAPRRSASKSMSARCPWTNSRTLTPPSCAGRSARSARSPASGR